MGSLHLELLWRFYQRREGMLVGVGGGCGTVTDAGVSKEGALETVEIEVDNGSGEEGKELAED